MSERNLCWYYLSPVKLLGGGQTRRVVESCRALAERRQTVLLAPAGPTPPIPHAQFRLLPMPDHPPRELVFQWRLFRMLGRAPDLPRPDVLFMLSASFNLGGILRARALGIPSVLEINGIPALEYTIEKRRHGLEAQARALVYRVIRRLEWRLASGLVVVTENLAREARAGGARHVHVTDNGVNPQLFLPQDMQVARAALGLPAEAKIVGFAGNFAAWQGLETLVQAALRLEDRPIHLLLIGDGVERAGLEVLAAPLGPRAHFTGMLPADKVSTWLSACDIFAAPFAPIHRNLRMGISALKLAEYMALGRPIIGSRLPGMEFIEREQVGMLFAPGDPAAMAEALRRFLDLPPEEQELFGQRSRAQAEGHYSWAQIVDRIIKFVEGLAERTR